MLTFIVRAHSAPVDPAKFMGALGEAAHVEYLAQIIVNTLFISKGHRDDVTLTLVLENSRDFSRAITLRGNAIGDLGGLNEATILDRLAGCLHQGQQLGKEESIVTDAGILVSATSFEHLAKQHLEQGRVYLLDRKGADLRDQPLQEPATFLLSDHVPMPRKLEKSLVRQGAEPVSLGPVMLHASQCVVLVQNEFDRRG